MRETRSFESVKVDPTTDSVSTCVQPVPFDAIKSGVLRRARDELAYLLSQDVIHDQLNG